MMTYAAFRANGMDGIGEKDFHVDNLGVFMSLKLLLVLLATNLSLSINLVIFKVFQKYKSPFHKYDCGGEIMVNKPEKGNPLQLQFNQWK